MVSFLFWSHRDLIVPPLIFFVFGAINFDVEALGREGGARDLGTRLGKSACTPLSFCSLFVLVYKQAKTQRDTQIK